MEIISSGIITVPAGVSSTGLYFIQEGVLQVVDKGWAQEIGLAEGGQAFVSSGGILYLCTVSSGGTVTVLSGGYAQDVTVENGGLYLVSSGGTAHKSLLKSGGTQIVRAGEMAASVTVMEGGVLHVSSGGYARNPVVSSGGFAYAWANALIDNAKVSGTLEVNANAAANSVSVLDGGKLAVLTGGYAYEAKISSGGTLDISSGGRANFAKVFEDGAVVVSAGASCNNAEINGGEVMLMGEVVPDDSDAETIPGGFASNTTVNSGGNLFVFSGGLAKSTKVNSGGCLFVEEGGSAKGIVENGGYVEYYGEDDEPTVTFAPSIINGLSLENASATVHSGTTATNTTVNEEGILEIYSGGIANSTTVNADGNMNVSSGGTAAAPTVNPGGYFLIEEGGSATGIVENGGYVDVRDGADVTFVPNIINELSLKNAYATIHSGTTVNSATINEYSRLDVYSGGTATEVIENGGYVYIENGAEVSFATNSISGLFLSNFSASVHSGTTACYTRIYSGGKLYIFSDGIADNTQVNDGRFYLSSGGTANNTAISHGIMIVAPGGMTNKATVNPGGELLVSSGGTATEIIENGGCVYVDDGADVVFTPNTISGLKLSAFATVHYGTTATDIVVIRNGKLLVFSGGTANNTVVSEGFFCISAGAEVNNTTVSRGYLYVYSGGIAKDTIVRSIMGCCCLSGGTATGTTVVNGGVFVVSDGGKADNTIVISGGSMIISSGGTATGNMSFDGTVVWVKEGGVIDFDLMQAGETALVNNLSVIRGTPLYTLTVSSEQAEGVYVLAEGAARFNSMISVVNTDGDKFGTLTVGGETVFVGDTGYTLNRTGSSLTVTVEEPAPSVPANLVGTKDRVSWDPAGAGGYVVEYSTDDFAHALPVDTAGNAVDMLDLPAGTYQWRVRTDDGEAWAVGDGIDSDNDTTPKVLQSNADGSDDIFFAQADGTWKGLYYAQHAGSVNDWSGTNEQVSAYGKNRLADLFFGSDDANILCLTDDGNGDGIFVDDEYTELPEGITAQQSRIARIDEIRAGAGNDIVDMTSNKFKYTGDGLTIRGGDGDDVIWANKGGNLLFGDAGNDRIVGASGNDVIAGGIGDDSMHGGGGNDVYTFCDNWGTDEVEQLAGGTVTLWFVEGSLDNWDEAAQTYTDGDNSVTVKGVNSVELKFGSGTTPDDAAQFAALSDLGAFDAFTSRKIFEDFGKGILAGQ